MTDKNAAVEIEQVANGFVVRPGYSMSRNNMYASAEVKVFQSFAALSEWMAEHFGHRNPSVRSDTP